MGYVLEQYTPSEIESDKNYQVYKRLLDQGDLKGFEGKHIAIQNQRIIGISTSITNNSLSDLAYTVMRVRAKESILIIKIARDKDEHPIVHGFDRH